MWLSASYLNGPLNGFLSFNLLGIQSELIDERGLIVKSYKLAKESL